jgi:hypothetical protein
MAHLSSPMHPCWLRTSNPAAKGTQTLEILEGQAPGRLGGGDGESRWRNDRTPNKREINNAHSFIKHFSAIFSRPISTRLPALESAHLRHCRMRCLAGGPTLQSIGTPFALTSLQLDASLCARHGAAELTVVLPPCRPKIFGLLSASYGRERISGSAARPGHTASVYAGCSPAATTASDAPSTDCTRRPASSA